MESPARLLSAPLVICRHKEISYIIKRDVICIHMMLCSYPECHIRLLEVYKKKKKFKYNHIFSPLDHPICHLMPQKEAASKIATYKVKKSITQNVS